MNFKDRLKQARNSRIFVQQEFLNNYHRGGVHLFVEGQEDALFYRHFALNYVQDNRQIFTYVCRGKEEVYRERKQVKQYIEEYPTPNLIALFFVDKDLDDLLERVYPVYSDVYVTDVYSIENYFVKPEIIWEVSTRVLLVNSYDTKEELVRIFEAQLAYFYGFIQWIMAWIVYHHRNALNPNLKNIMLNNLFEITEQFEVKCLYDEIGIYRELEMMARCKTHLNYELEKANILFLLTQLQPHVYVRGKYALWFMEAFIKNMCVVVNQIHLFSAFKNLDENIQSIIAYLPIPPSLKDFLDYHLSNYRREAL